MLANAWKVFYTYEMLLSYKNLTLKKLKNIFSFFLRLFILAFYSQIYFGGKSCQNKSLEIIFQVYLLLNISLYLSNIPLCGYINKYIVFCKYICIEQVYIQQIHLNVFKLSCIFMCIGFNLFHFLCFATSGICFIKTLLPETRFQHQ